MEFEQVIENRVSTRSFLPKPIPDEDIEYILQSARKAPSWMNKQCWRFIVVQDLAVIQQLAKASVINRWIRDAPVIIIACADPNQSGFNNDIPYYIADVSIALEHIVLAATDRGLGTCWIGSFNEKKIKEILEIPPRIKIVALTPVGYPLDKDSLGSKTRKIFVRSTKRNSLKEFVHWNHW